MPNIKAMSGISGLEVIGSDDASISITGTQIDNAISVSGTIEQVEALVQGYLDTITATKDYYLCVHVHTTNPYKAAYLCCDTADDVMPNWWVT